jgi:hypothetical protein
VTRKPAMRTRDSLTRSSAEMGRAGPGKEKRLSYLVSSEVVYDTRTKRLGADSKIFPYLVSPWLRLV